MSKSQMDWSRACRRTSRTGSRGHGPNERCWKAGLHPPSSRSAPKGAATNSAETFERSRHRRPFSLAAGFRPKDRVDFQPWLDRVEASEDPLFFTVIDKASGRIAGRQTLMRIDPANGVIEIGNIYWGSLISRKPAATEAQFLFA